MIHSALNINGIVKLALIQLQLALTASEDPG